MRSAIKSQQREVIRLLLQDKRLNLSVANSDDKTPFGVALATRDEDTARAILDCHAGAAEECNSRGMTFLHSAVVASDVESVQFLLSVGANVNTPVRDPSQRTALALAVTAGNARIVDLLLRARANHSIPEPSSKLTPLHVAANLGLLEIVELLVKAGVPRDAARRRVTTCRLRRECWRRSGRDQPARGDQGRPRSGGG